MLLLLLLLLLFHLMIVTLISYLVHETYSDETQVRR